MNKELMEFYEDICALNVGASVYNVIPDVEAEKIDSWRKQLIDEGFYVNISFLGSTVDIYYASPDYVKDNFEDAFTTGGWTN